MKQDIELIVPTYPTDKRPKRGAILASGLGGIASSVIGLAYEGISLFLHHKRHKALHKAVTVMEKKTVLQKNQIHHLEDTMIMCGVYNQDTLAALVRTVQHMQNTTSGRKNLCRQINYNVSSIYERGMCAQLCNKLFYF